MKDRVVALVGFPPNPTSARKLHTLVSAFPIERGIGKHP
jgi:hypothetical protein